jgi:hypothetical protein
MNSSQAYQKKGNSSNFPSKLGKNEEKRNIQNSKLQATSKSFIEQGLLNIIKHNRSIR